jgi:nitroreductase
MQAALRAPDHRCLTPWRFIVCTGKGLNKLGDIFQQAAILADADEAVVTRAAQLPLRAPMVIVAIADYKEDEKVPRVEQIASTACAVNAMQMAAVAQGFQGVWRTGSYAKDESVKQAFNCKPEDEILGFLYVGSSTIQPLPKPSRMSEQFFTLWNQ